MWYDSKMYKTKTEFNPAILESVRKPGRLEEYGETGLLLVAYRLNSSMSQRELSLAMSITPPALQKLEMSKNPITKKLANRLASIFEEDEPKLFRAGFSEVEFTEKVFQPLKSKKKKTSGSTPETQTAV